MPALEPHPTMRKLPRYREGKQLAKVTQPCSPQGTLPYSTISITHGVGPTIYTPRAKLASKGDTHQCHLPPKGTPSYALSLIFRKKPRRSRQPWFLRPSPFGAADSAWCWWVMQEPPGRGQGKVRLLTSSCPGALASPLQEGLPDSGANLPSPLPSPLPSLLGPAGSQRSALLPPCPQQPLRARHCRECRRCVRRYDHHCPWMENCVGERNHPLFVAYLALQLVVLLWGLYLAWWVVPPPGVWGAG